MRTIAMTAALALMAAPAVGLAQTAPQAPPAAPVPPSEGQRAGQSFRDAGGSIANAARSTWHGLQHGWEATKEGARAGWSATTKGPPPEPHSPATPEQGK